MRPAAMSGLYAGMKISDAVRRVAATLTEASIDGAAHDARLLVHAATGASREELALDPSRVLSADEAMRLNDIAGRRLTREPITRILGERSFWGRIFEVTSATLDPRPDTETLVEMALEIAHNEGARARPIRLLDIGTGSGCIAITLLAELPSATAVGSDISPEALAIAGRNAQRLGVVDRIELRLARGLSGIAEPFDFVVSNPPYIATTDINSLEPEVRLFDPHAALDGGSDGLDMIREIIAWSVGQADTWLVLEHGAGQEKAVRHLIAEHCGEATARRAVVRKDLGGHTRCVAWKPQI